METILPSDAFQHLAFAGGTGAGEILLVFVAVLILFGPRKLPEFARMLGRAAQRLRRASAEFHDEIMRLEDGNGTDKQSGNEDNTKPGVYEEVDGERGDDSNDLAG
ncbi:MAG: twin-arginine translocase TatA/TatE family subunit [Kiritimatiellia bacterium]